MSPNKEEPQFSGEIPNTEDNVQALYDMCHSQDGLARRRYQFEEDPSGRIETKLRCTKCLDRIVREKEIANTNYHTNIPTRRCTYHPGRVIAGKWKCCNGNIKSPGCVWTTHHNIPANTEPTLQEYWRYYKTPVAAAPLTTKNNAVEAKKTQSRKKQKWSVFMEHLNQHRQAVVLDCEMGVSYMKWPELIRYSLVDFFTGEKLIDSLVLPDVHMRSLSTPWSGVTWDMMWEAVNTSTCFFGRDAAREGLWRFVGPETIMVVHAGENDMNVLRCIHPYIVDTQKLYGGQFGLKGICGEMTGISIQNGDGHDSLEDAMATREIAYIFLKQQVEATGEATQTNTTTTLMLQAPTTRLSYAAVVRAAAPATPNTNDYDIFEDEARLGVVDDAFDGERIDFRVGPRARM